MGSILPRWQRTEKKLFTHIQLVSVHFNHIAVSDSTSSSAVGLQLRSCLIRYRRGYHSILQLQVITNRNHYRVTLKKAEDNVWDCQTNLTVLLLLYIIDPRMVSRSYTHVTKYGRLLKDSRWEHLTLVFTMSPWITETVRSPNTSFPSLVNENPSIGGPKTESEYMYTVHSICIQYMYTVSSNYYANSVYKPHSRSGSALLLNGYGDGIMSHNCYLQRKNFNRIWFSTVSSFVYVGCGAWRQAF